MPGFLYKYEQFRRQFETPIVKYEDKAASERLKKMVAPFLLRRLKENVLKELPEKLEKQQTVVMESAQQTLYDAQVQHLKVMIEQAKKDKSFNEIINYGLGIAIVAYNTLGKGSPILRI